MSAAAWLPPPATLPADQTAEKTLLGICLLDPGQIRECAAIATPNDFFFDAEKVVWRELLRRDADNEEISIVSVGMAMNEQVGAATVDAAFVAELTTGILRRSSGKYYAGIIANKAHLRRQMVVARDIFISAGQPGADPVNIAGRLRAAAELQPTTGAGVWASAEPMASFLTRDDAEVPWLVPGILAPGNLTQIFAPRGLGKSLLAAHWAVQLAGAGRRVIYLDRDNPRHTLRARLRAFGADGEATPTLKALARDRCPPLTRPEEWASFPWSEYQAVIVDSLDSMAPGTGEQDSSRISRCLEPLLDICHRENGPAVLVLGNTIKTAAHSRGSGVVEDRADIVIEARDVTEFRPSGSKPWIEELPEQGAANWQQRSGRRQQRQTLRLALVPTKFRLAEEPAPWVLEINLAEDPWQVCDVTADVDAAGEHERRARSDAKAAELAAAVQRLAREIERREHATEPPLTWRAAEAHLIASGCKRRLARAAMQDRAFEHVDVPGRGNPSVIRLRGKTAESGANTPVPEAAPNAAASDADLRRADPERAAQIAHPEQQYPCGDSEAVICAVIPKHTPPPAPPALDFGGLESLWASEDGTV